MFLPINPGDLTAIKNDLNVTFDGRWIDGTHNGFRFQILAHAGNPDHNGTGMESTPRITKLWVQRNSNKETVANYDRGWDVKPVDEDAVALVSKLMAYFI